MTSESESVGNSVMSNSLRPYQTPLSMGFSRQEYWSGFPFLSPEESSPARDQTQVSCMQNVSLLTEPSGKPW